MVYTTGTSDSRRGACRFSIQGIIQGFLSWLIPMVSFLLCTSLLWTWLSRHVHPWCLILQGPGNRYTWMHAITTPSGRDDAARGLMRIGQRVRT